MRVRGRALVAALLALVDAPPAAVAPRVAKASRLAAEYGAHLARTGATSGDLVGAFTTFRGPFRDRLVELLTTRRPAGRDPVRLLAAADGHVDRLLLVMLRAFEDAAAPVGHGQGAA